MSSNKNNSAPNIRLKSKVLLQLKKNKKCVRALEDLHEKSYYTLQAWLRNNDPQLCRHDSLLVIGAYLRKEIDDMVEYPNGATVANTL